MDASDRSAIADELLARLRPGLDELEASVARRLHDALAAEFSARFARLRDEVLDRHARCLDVLYEDLSRRMDDALDEGEAWKRGIDVEEEG